MDHACKQQACQNHSEQITRPHKPSKVVKREETTRARAPSALNGNTGKNVNECSFIGRLQRISALDLFLCFMRIIKLMLDATFPTFLVGQRLALQRRILRLLVLSVKLNNDPENSTL